MSKNLVLNLIWRNDEFVITDSKADTLGDEAVLTIDENKESISLRIPSHFSLISKKIIERRVASIAKSGFTIPKSQIRVGLGFEISVSTEEVIPDVLLQEGHKYSYDEGFTAVKRVTDTSSVPEPEKYIVSDEEYVPSFLKYESEGSSEIRKVASHEPKVERTQVQIEPEKEPETVPEAPPQPDQIIDTGEKLTENGETVAGRFILALSKTGDVYLSRKENYFIAEYSVGRVEFEVVNQKINILATKRIPENDQTLNQAKEFAEEKI
ncbi:MAG: hypothetical protein EAX86_07805 [Candidatus Heimdallarchaeota archaeon]|nr:hypothetical protein [Candidatus Heimdallarchaeota archaeon]